MPSHISGEAKNPDDRPRIGDDPCKWMNHNRHTDFTSHNISFTTFNTVRSYDSIYVFSKFR